MCEPLPTRQTSTDKLLSKQPLLTVGRSDNPRHSHATAERCISPKVCFHWRGWRVCSCIGLRNGVWNSETRPRPKKGTKKKKKGEESGDKRSTDTGVREHGWNRRVTAAVSHPRLCQRHTNTNTKTHTPSLSLSLSWTH